MRFPGIETVLHLLVIIILLLYCHSLYAFSSNFYYILSYVSCISSPKRFKPTSYIIIKLDNKKVTKFCRKLSVSFKIWLQ